MRSVSPFSAIWATLAKGGQGPSPRVFHVQLSGKAQKQMAKLGPDFQGRVKKVIARVHNTPIDQPNLYLTKLTENQHKNVGLPHGSTGFSIGDYRSRMLGVLDGHVMTILDVGTREDSKHTGRTPR